jgi:hypothetical protein
MPHFYHSTAEIRDHLNLLLGQLIVSNGQLRELTVARLPAPNTPLLWIGLSAWSRTVGGCRTPRS